MLKHPIASAPATAASIGPTNGPDRLGALAVHAARLPFAAHGDCCQSTPTPTATPTPAAGPSRRRRLWELPGSAHCPVVGVCLPVAALRRLVDKLPGMTAPPEDHVLHSAAVAECRHRLALAEALQRELDRRHAGALRQSTALKTADALADWWQAKLPTADMPAALWATLTHPRCLPTLERRVLGEVHMLQHQVGLAGRDGLARIEALIDENAVLSRALGAAQQRCTRLAAEHAERLATLSSELVRVRGQCLAAQSRRCAVEEDLAQWRASVPDLPERHALQRQVAEQAERIATLQRALQLTRMSPAADRAPSHQQPANDAAAAGTNAGTTAAAAAAAAANATATATAAGQAASLAERAVLCVGGRAASVPVYRRLVEACGARFLHHDGGEEQNVHQLDNTLAAADLVICQAGCISHKAYWRVKDHCKRTGKRCVFVESPSAAGLQRALVGIGQQGG